MSMKVGNPITDVANAVAHAQIIGLPAIKHERAQRPEGMEFSEYKRQLTAGTLPKVIEDVRPNLEDFDVFMYPQMWGSTALGFGGMGGASIRQANTVAIVCRKVRTAAIYFAGQHAYNVDLTDPTVQKRLNDDIRDRRIASRTEALERYKALAPAADPESPGTEGGVAP